MTNPPDLDRFHAFRWRVVLASFLLVFGLAGAALAEVWNQGKTLDDRVQRQLEHSHRIDTAVDAVRVPICAVLYASLSRPSAGFTPEQVQARGIYLAVYGRGTSTRPGLNCPLPLPKGR